MRPVRSVSVMVILLVVFSGLVSGGSLHRDVRVVGYAVGKEILITGTMVEGDSIYLLMEAQNEGGETAHLLAMIDDRLDLTPMASYREVGGNHYITPITLVRYGNGFLIAGTLHPGDTEKPGGGFWISFVDDRLNVVWTRAYLTKYSSSVFRIIPDSRTGKILLVGDGCFYSGSDGFLAVFDPEKKDIERMIGIGGINADGVSTVLLPEDGTYLVVGSTWSMGDSQEKLFLLRLDREFRVISSRAFTVSKNEKPVKRLELNGLHAVLEGNRVNVSGTFVVEEFHPTKTIVVNSGIWRAEFDRDLKPVEYRFETTTLNSSPIELGSPAWIFRRRGDLILSSVNLRYPMVMVGRFGRDSIRGELIGVPYPAGAYYYLTYPLTAVFRKESLTVLLQARRFSDRNFRVYSNSMVAVDVPYERLDNLSVLKEYYLYGGNVTIKLHPWNVSLDDASDIVRRDLSYGIRLVDVRPKSVSLKLLRRSAFPKIIYLKKPRPVGELKVYLGKGFIDINPLRIYLDGREISPDEWYVLPAGNHTLTVRRPGFIPYTEKIEVKPNAAHHRNLEYVGFLDLSVVPGDANLTIGGRFYDLNSTNGSIRMILSPCRCNITVRRKGYLPYSGEVILMPGQYVTRKIVLKPRPGNLLVESSPRAIIWVNGSAWGLTPGNITLPPGEYRITLTREGYANYSTRINLDPGDSRWLNVTLQPVQTVSNETTGYQKTSTERTPKPGRKKGKSVCGPAIMALLATSVALLRRDGS
ncbi:PEGA domain-containing protein [Thermococcus sp.]|uniref:PEGA domain-containing protein n=1 Tax=Thermococcus sp. TaxID=35749 RepID=UPI0026287A51|nr:PEGA domain-containing protein [Thermococcus sp.]